MRIRNLAIAALLTASMAGCAWSQRSESSAKKQPAGEPVSKVVFSEKNEKKKMMIEAEYPRLSPEQPSSGAFNRAVKAHVMDIVGGFRRDMSVMTGEELDFLPKGVMLTLDIGYVVESLGERYASVNFGIETYTGGAHPNHRTSTLNFDLLQNKEIELSELFVPKSGFLKIISDQSIAVLKKKLEDFVDEDWIRRGAGPDPENFKSWAITGSGLKFFFDPYQVGPYVAGGFEVVIPYEKFGEDIRSSAFPLSGSVSDSGGDPSSWCGNGLFTGRAAQVGLAKVNGTRNSRAYFYDEADECPKGKNCRQKSYVIPGDELIVSKSRGRFVCAWFQPGKGSETVGWMLRERLVPVPENDSVPLSAWTGEWTYGGNDLTISQSRNGLAVRGNAFWRGLGDNIHIGEVDDEGAPVGRTLELGEKGEYDCRVRLKLIGPLLLVADNKQCGGVNVTFDGVYRNGK